jgi:hypothetical protein
MRKWFCSGCHSSPFLIVDDSAWYDPLTMADEPTKISVQVSADELKALSMATGDAAPAGKAQVTLQISPESAKKFISLWEDFLAFEKSQVADSHTSVDRIIKTSEMRISFYEKLILLAAGSFALSLTFLGSLQRHANQGSPLAAMGRLEAGWILLLVCIVFSWLHNLHRTNAVENASAANASLVNAMQHKWKSRHFEIAAALLKGAESPSTGLSEAFTMLAQALTSTSKTSMEGGAERIREFKRYYYRSALLGGIALISIIFAFILIAVFALKNASLL